MKLTRITVDPAQMGRARRDLLATQHAEVAVQPGLTAFLSPARGLSRTPRVPDIGCTIALVRDQSASVPAHRAIPHALRLAGDAHEGTVVWRWVDSDKLPKSPLFRAPGSMPSSEDNRPGRNIAVDSG